MATYKCKPLPPLAYLHECFLLDAQAGTLVWQRRPQQHFNTYRGFANWNHRYAGRIAGTISNTGYRVVLINAVGFKVARVVYALHNGVDPADMYVDHINGDKTDDRPINLRLATPAENSANVRNARAGSTTGVRGVMPDKATGKFRAEIVVEGRKHYLGQFDTVFAAEAAYKAAKTSLCGDFAPQT